MRCGRDIITWGNLTGVYVDEIKTLEQVNFILSRTPRVLASFLTI